VAAAWGRSPDHAEVGQLLVDTGLAVATVSGHRPWHVPGAGDDPPDGGGQQRGVGWVADHDLMFEHDPVGVVEDLGLVAELDRGADAALAERPDVRVVQADQPAGPVRHPAGKAGVEVDPEGLDEHRVVQQSVHHPRQLGGQDRFPQ
jgi:hypothetical protein